MENRWLRTFPEEKKPTCKDAEEFLPDPDYLHVFLAQMVRHYEPMLSFEFNEAAGWYLIAKYKKEKLFTVYIQNHFFIVRVKVAINLDPLLQPMLVVMSDQVNQKFLDTKPVDETRIFQIEIKSEKEMEDAVYLISLRAKTLRGTK